jgi:hypothetical protein
VDYEYERNGTASIFMFAEPLSGFRQATARARRTKEDWAIEVAQMLDTRYADCDEVTLVCDHLKTHTKGAFYEAFEPDRARAYWKRIRFCYTPKHGSWLNVAECELSCLTSQCLSDRRMGELAELQTEIAAWSEKTNAKQRENFISVPGGYNEYRGELSSVYVFEPVLSASIVLAQNL